MRSNVLLRGVLVAVFGCGGGSAREGAADVLPDDASRGGDVSAEVATDAGDATATPLDSSVDGPEDTGEPASVFAIIGDYGVCSPACPAVYSATCDAGERAVAKLVHGWSPRAILTTGDDSYGSGSAAQVSGDQEPYLADITAGVFWPSFGNHDWLSSAGITPSLSFFKLARPYYVQSFGSLIDFYMLDTNPQDADGDLSTSAQAKWFAARASASTSAWKVSVNHQAPYSSCGEFSYDGSGGRPDYRWVAGPGIDLVLSGHSHVYERLIEPSAVGSKSIDHVVVGCSGAPLQGSCATKLPGQQASIYGAFGALRLDVTRARVVLRFFDVAGVVRDTRTLTK